MVLSLSWCPRSSCSPSKTSSEKTVVRTSCRKLCPFKVTFLWRTSLEKSILSHSLLYLASTAWSRLRLDGAGKPSSSYLILRFKDRSCSWAFLHSFAVSSCLWINCYEIYSVKDEMQSEDSETRTLSMNGHSVEVTIITFGKTDHSPILPSWRCDNPSASVFFFYCSCIWLWSYNHSEKLPNVARWYQALLWSECTLDDYYQ